MLHPDLASLIESGVSIIVGTRDGALRPDAVRGFGAKVDEATSTVSVLLPVALAGTSLVNMVDNRRVAVTLARIHDHYTIQLKGEVVAITRADPSWRGHVDRYRRAVATELEVVGLPPHVVFQATHWPCWLVTFRPELVFDQTPGPAAGEQLDARLPHLPSLALQESLSLEGAGEVVVPPRTATVALDGLEYACFQGVLPSQIATCDRDGEPNITYLSQVHLVDSRHVALSCQFFNKTKRNLLENPFATVLLYHPLSFEVWRLRMRFVREELEGPLFDAMAARIEVIASHTGMAGIFRLLSADIHEVLAVDQLVDFLTPTTDLLVAAPTPPAGERLSELRGLQTISARIATAHDLEGLLASALEALDELLGLSHTMVLVVDDTGHGLVALGSHGYGESGLGPAGSGAEVSFGCGVIGGAAQSRRMVRVTGITSGLSYGRTIRGQLETLSPNRPLCAPIELPGLPDAQAQLALPMLVGDQLIGVLAAESRNPLAFDEWDEAFLQIVANQIALRIEGFLDDEEEADSTPPSAVADTAGGVPRALSQRVRHFVFYRNDDAVFVDGEYLIRNVPGRILWKILTLDATTGRRELANRELRLDRSLGLPAYRDNLESRLILLRKRLEARCPDVRLVPVRRGRFALETDSAIELEERDTF